MLCHSDAIHVFLLITRSESQTRTHQLCYMWICAHGTRSHADIFRVFASLYYLSYYLPPEQARTRRYRHSEQQNGNTRFAILVQKQSSQFSTSKSTVSIRWIPALRIISVFPQLPTYTLVVPIRTVGTALGIFQHMESFAMGIFYLWNWERKSWRQSKPR